MKQSDECNQSDGRNLYSTVKKVLLWILGALFAWSILSICFLVVLLVIVIIFNPYTFCLIVFCLGVFSGVFYPKILIKFSVFWLILLSIIIMGGMMSV